MTSNCLFLNIPFLHSTDQIVGNRLYRNPVLLFQNRSSFQSRRISFPIRAVTAMESEQSGGTAYVESGSTQSMNLLFVEMGVGYDQHGYVSLYSDLFLYRTLEMMNYLHAAKMSLLQLCGLVGMLSPPILFLLFGEVFVCLVSVFLFV